MTDKKRILIVEDDEDIRMVEEAYLGAVGFDTCPASNAVETEQLLKTENFDLILLDVMLPGKSGYDICKEIRASLDIPILMVTARMTILPSRLIRQSSSRASMRISDSMSASQKSSRVDSRRRSGSRICAS